MQILKYYTYYSIIPSSFSRSVSPLRGFWIILFFVKRENRIFIFLTDFE